MFCQKPKLPEPCDSHSPSKAFPKPPPDPDEVRSRLAGARGRAIRKETPLDGDTHGTRAKYVMKGFEKKFAATVFQWTISWMVVAAVLPCRHWFRGSFFSGPEWSHSQAPPYLIYILCHCAQWKSELNAAVSSWPWTPTESIRIRAWNVTHPSCQPLHTPLRLAVGSQHWLGLKSPSQKSRFRMIELIGVNPWGNMPPHPNRNIKKYTTKKKSSLHFNKHRGNEAQRFNCFVQSLTACFKDVMLTMKYSISS